MDWVARIAERYRNCQTYADRGRVFSRGTLFGRFSTRFRREGEILDFVFDEPNGTHFELASRGARAEIRVPWSVPTWFDVPIDTPELCIAGLTGVTGSAVCHAPRLLMPDRVDVPSILGHGEMEPILMASDAWSLTFMIVTYGEPSVAVFDAQTLLLRADGDGEAGEIVRDWARFESVVVYDEVDVT